MTDIINSSNLNAPSVEEQCKVEPLYPIDDKTMKEMLVNEYHYYNRYINQLDSDRNNIHRSNLIPASYSMMNYAKLGYLISTTREQQRHNC